MKVHQNPYDLFGYLCCLGIVFCDNPMHQATGGPVINLPNEFIPLPKQLPENNIHPVMNYSTTVLQKPTHKTATGMCSDHCPCHFTDRDILLMVCVTPNRLDSFPYLNNTAVMGNITSIKVDQQQRLMRIGEQDLLPYVSLENLTIQNSGLRYIAVNAFKHLSHLQYLSLVNNHIQHLPWRMFVTTPASLFIQGNPLICNCSAWWIKEYVQNGLLAANCDTGESLSTTEIPNCGPPTILIEPTSFTIEEGENMTVTCAGSGTPAPTVYWNVQGIISNITITSESQGRLKRLVIHTASGEDNGNISCVSVNEASSKTAVVEVNIKAPPVIIELFVKTGFYDCIDYTIISFPEPVIEWLHNGQTLTTFGEDSSIDHQPRNDVRNTNNKTRKKLIKGCLSFKMDNFMHNGNYTLVATNELGSVNRSIYYHKAIPKVIGGGGMANLGGFAPKPFMPTKPSTKDIVSVVGERRHDMPTSDKQIEIYIIAGVGVFLFASTMVTSTLCYYRFKQHGHKRFSRDSSSITPRSHESMPLTPDQIVQNPNYSIKPNIMDIAITRIRPEFVSCIEQLGEGAFGRVFLGRCENMPKEGETVMVAVKMLKSDMSEDSMRDFEREAEVLTNMDHKNIVTFYGVCIEEETYMMVFEYMLNGDLNYYLRKHGPDGVLFGNFSSHQILSESDLLNIGLQISDGMSYLASHHFVHRDLATRNCLVGDSMVVKIGDFGMTRDVYSTDYYKVGGSAMLPVRWLPPESLLYRTFTIESDIWSFGVVLWEIFSYGKQPWFHLSNHEVVQYIIDGHLLDCPPTCPEEVWKLMMSCWKRQPQERMPMFVIQKHLQRLLMMDTVSQLDSIYE